MLDTDPLPHDRFVGYFLERLAEMRTIQGPAAKIFQEILLVSLLDALARSVYPRSGNRERFVSLIREFGQWPDCDRVSLTHLCRLLSLTPDPAFERVRLFANKRLASWRAPWSDIPLSEDPTFEEVEALWPRQTDLRRPIEGAGLESLRHSELLYAYRNSLVHELRHPGYGFDLGDEAAPFYHDLSHQESETESRESIELVYPTRFLFALVERALHELRGYYHRNQLNPYDYYKFGTYWVAQLN